ncbi:MAG: alcohol dehydrogenase catalytic domain-containing protein, partial [Chloroflexi bacterium]|nr:alcohol dehydrogenase catalytic domain-containing protein [Chloroflexota bacterium]
MSTQTVRAMVLREPDRLELQEFDWPRIGPDEGLLEVELAGICGTDVKYFHGKLAIPLPLIMGHEILGRIAEVGERFAERYQLRVGDRVVVEGSVPCWSCLECQTGSYRFCKSRKGYGTTTSSSLPPHLWGAYASLMYLAPGSIVHKVSREVPAEAAVLSSGVIANGIQWGRTMSGLKHQDTVVVQGCGPQGLACALVAHECGADRVIVTGLSRDADRLALAREFGADRTIDVERENPVEVLRDLTGGRMADVVVDVSGSPKAIATSIELVRKQGTMVLGGLTGKDTITSLK